MVDESSEKAKGTEPRQKESAGSARKAVARRGVPRFALSSAEEYAVKLWEAVRQGIATEETLARALGGPEAKASGGAWRTKMAAFKTWGVATWPQSGHVQLSPLGLRIVNHADPDAQAAARRDAVLGIAPYAEILRNSDGSQLPGRVGLEGKFEFEYSMSKDDAKKAADDFESSVKLAGLIDAAGNVKLSQAEHEQADRSIEEDEQDIAGQSLAGEIASGGESVDGRTAGRIAVDGHEAEGRLGAASNSYVNYPKLEVQIGIDTSAWDPDDVIRLLTVIGYGKSDD